MEEILWHSFNYERELTWTATKVCALLGEAVDEDLISWVDIPGQMSSDIRMDIFCRHPQGYMVDIYVNQMLTWLLPNNVSPHQFYKLIRKFTFNVLTKYKVYLEGFRKSKL